ncbi:MAG: MotA/TolQ/ExbB proton channel family protein [Gemmatimonadetes bacterium]|nr:MotA/TolQ/ExbB proton channel family protein [Gemmatimonadota bacterium]
MIDDLALLLERGGYVMLPLLVMSIVSLTLIVERAWFWSVSHRPARVKRLARLNDTFRRGDRASAAELVANDRSPYGEVARHLLGHGATEAVAVEAVESQRPRIDRFMATLSTIITAAPLLGILGTVIGIIQSFNLLGEQDTLTDPRTVSAGIAEALLTTALGLVIALITLFPFMIFRGHVDRAIGRLESVKRIELAIEAIALADSAVRLVVVGDGTERPRLARLIEDRKVGDRVDLAGWVDDDTLIELYAGALGVVYAPYDEDYGYVTLEAFLAHRPVITAADSGEPLEFVEVVGGDHDGAVLAPEIGYDIPKSLRPERIETVRWLVQHDEVAVAQQGLG